VAKIYKKTISSCLKPSAITPPQIIHMIRLIPKPATSNDFALLGRMRIYLSGFNLFTLFLLTSCSSLPQVLHDPSFRIQGLYISDHNKQFWLALQASNRYLLCDRWQCFSGEYERLQVNYAVVLRDFYNNPIGQKIEALSHGDNAPEKLVTDLRQLRLRQPRPMDQALHFDPCGETYCAGIGHRRNGIKFFQLTGFEQ